MSGEGMPLATVLVADDSEDNRELLSQMLRVQGYRVVCAADGAEALDVLAGQPIDLALVDVMMPRCTGFAVCRTVKARPETRLIPVVLITGLRSADDRIRGIESGADDFLNKPIRKEELLARVRSLVRLKRFTDELENAETVLCSLAHSIEAKDPYTEGHCERLSRYSIALAERLGLPEEQRVALRRAGVVHDIGKVAVPEQILLKPGPIDTDERRILENHQGIVIRIYALTKSFAVDQDVIPYPSDSM